MEFKQLFENFSQAGKVVSISLRTHPMGPIKNVDGALAIKDLGLEGDRYKNRGGARQVTLIQSEHLDAVASYLGKLRIDPSLTRRNIVVKGINLLALKGKTFQIGKAVFEYSGQCHPCSRMEQNLGKGGYNAMRGHGGITAKIIKDGMIKVGDQVISIPD